VQERVRHAPSAAMLIGDSVTYQGRRYVVVGFTPMSVIPSEVQLRDPQTGKHVLGRARTQPDRASRVEDRPAPRAPRRRLGSDDPSPQRQGDDESRQRTRTVLTRHPPPGTFLTNFKGLPEKIQTANGPGLLRDVGFVTFADTFDLETGDFISSEVVINKEPHPDLDSDFALFCEVVTEALA
jgi:hypothetical protein